MHGWKDGFGHGGFRHHCGCPEHDSQQRRGGLLLPTLLLLLKVKPAHGYELMEKLSDLTYVQALPDPGVVYRHLRRLEEDGMVDSQLEPGSGGPARKVYVLTPEGESYLRAWANILQARKKSLESFLEEFYRLFPPPEGAKDR